MKQGSGGEVSRLEVFGYSHSHNKETRSQRSYGCITMTSHPRDPYQPQPDSKDMSRKSLIARDVLIKNEKRCHSYPRH
jgi:hypothetical protein